MDKPQGLTVEALRRTVEILKRRAEPDVIVLTPRLYAYARRRGYLRNRNYLFIRAKKVGR